MIPSAESGHALTSVVEQYMTAVEQDCRSDAEKLLARRHAGYTEFGEPNASSKTPFSFDWFRYFREHGFILLESAAREESGLWATVETKCIATDGSRRTSKAFVLFRLFRENDSWTISDISLSLDVDVRDDEAW